MYSLAELHSQPQWVNSTSYDYAMERSLKSTLYKKTSCFDTAKNIEEIVDVTQKYKEHRYLLSIVNSLPNAAILKSNQDLSILSENKSYKEISKNWPAQTILEIIALEQSVLEDESPIHNMPMTEFIGENGKINRLSVTITLIKDGKNKLLGILTCCNETSDKISHDKLFSMYHEFYDDAKIATKMFICHIGLNKYLITEKEILTNRELDCLIMLSKGKTAKETARELNISPRTVETHLENIKIKFDARNKTEMLAIFLSCFNQSRK